MRNGTDRDIALKIVDDMESISTLLQTINANLYSPYILAQPEDQTVAIGGTCSLSLSAANVSAYQWQVKTAQGDWEDSLVTGNKTNTLTFTIEARHYTYTYRCKLTGTDGVVVYSDTAKVLEPEGE